MKKLIILLMVIIFPLAFSSNPLFAAHGSGHSGHGGGSYGHNYNHGGGSGHGGGSYGHNNNHGGYNGHGGHNYSHNYGHGGHGYCGHGHHDYWYDYGWEAAAIGLGAAVVGSAIINSYPEEHVTVVEREPYYYPAPSPPPVYYAPSRVWIPGHYVHEGGGHYTYIPGRWVE